MGLEFTQKWAARVQPSWAKRALFWTPMASPQNRSQPTQRSLCFLLRARGAQAGRVLFPGGLLAKAPESPELAWSGAQSYRAALRTVLTQGLVRHVSVGKGLKSGATRPLQEATGNPWLQATQNNSKPNPVPPLWEQTKVASPLLPSSEEVH